MERGVQLTPAQKASRSEVVVNGFEGVAREWHATIHLGQVSAEQCRKMLQTWADYLDKLRTGAEIIPIVRSRGRSVARSPTTDKMG